MRATRRRFLRGIVAVTAAATVTSAARWTVATASAATAPVTLAAKSHRLSVQTPSVPRQLQTGADWTELIPGQRIRTVFAPASGALLAATDTELLRSDNAGASWRGLPLPAREPGAYLGVDPTNHDTLYAATLTGLERSDDAGGSWRPILAPVLPTVRLAVSPADPRVLYLAHHDQSRYLLQHSLDGGATWDVLEEVRASMCGFGVYILTPHPTDPMRLFRTTGCYAGRNLGDSLDESRDNGATFQRLFTPKTAFPVEIVGGGGSDPGRFYLAVNKDFREGGSQLLTSADDGVTWTAILDNVGGGTMQGAKVPSVTITGLAYDPAQMDHVFQSQQQQAGSDAASATHAVMVSVDSGTTWKMLGQSPLPAIHQLAFGIDGRNLFAATEGGLLGIAVG